MRTAITRRQPRSNERTYQLPANLNVVRAPRRAIAVPIPRQRVLQGRAYRWAPTNSHVYGPDALRFYLSGAASDGADQDVFADSLGGYRSSTEATRVGFIYRTPIANATVLFASRANGVDGKVGSLIVVDDDVLAYCAYGSTTVGPAVAFANGDTKTLVDGETPSKYIRVQRTSSAVFAGGGLVEFDEQFNNVFGLSNAADAEHAAGSSKYRAVMLRSHAHASGIYAWLSTLGTSAVSSAVQLGGAGAGTLGSTSTAFADWPHKGWCAVYNGSTEREIVFYSSRTNSVLTVPSYGRSRLGTSAAAGSATDVLYPIPGFRIAYEAAASNGSVQTIASESTAPTGVTWKTGLSSSTGVSIGVLNLSQNGALWLHRELPAGIAACSKYFSQVKVQYTVEGQTYTETLAGLFRVADDSLDRYELRIGTNAAPALTASPVTTSATLPITYGTPLSSGNTYYLAVDKRNKYDMNSQRTDYTKVRVTGAGGVAAAPSAPSVISWRAGPAGVFILELVYLYGVDGDNAGDSYQLFATYDGSTPSSGGAATDTVSIVKMDGTGYLKYTTAAKANGTVGKILVNVLRASDSVASADTAVYTATASTSGLSAPSGSAHWRQIAEQK